MRRFLIAGFAVGLLLSGLGCRHSLFRRPCNTCNDPSPRNRDGTRLEDPLPSSGSRISPPGVPTTPNDNFPPPSVPERRFRIDPYAPPDRQLVPTEVVPGPLRIPPQEILLPPDNPNSDSTGPVVRSYLNEPLPPAGTRLPQRDAASPTTSGDLPPRLNGSIPPSQSNAKPMPGSLKGLSDYTTIAGREGVANGKLPTPEGLDTLKANGFRTVLVLHDPSSDSAATKEMVEKRGLKFVAIAVSPTTLRKSLDDFTLTITDSATKPVYVADDTGVRAGSLWYLFFRTSEMRSDDVARVRATPLGLPTTTTEEGKQFWLAIQQVLAKA